MVTRAEVDRLLQFHNDEYLVTSCYLNLDRAKWQPQVLKIRVKDLLQSAQQELSAKAGGHAQRESLRDDLARIEEFALQEIGTNPSQGSGHLLLRGAEVLADVRAAADRAQHPHRRSIPRTSARSWRSWRNTTGTASCWSIA